MTMEITKADFVDWRSNPVTKAFLGVCLDRAREAKDVLAVTAGLDSGQDSFYRGFIHAYQEMFEFRVDDVDETQEA